MVSAFFYLLFALVFQDQLVIGKQILSQKLAEINFLICYFYIFLKFF